MPVNLIAHHVFFRTYSDSSELDSLMYDFKRFSQGDLFTATFFLSYEKRQISTAIYNVHFVYIGFGGSGQMRSRAGQSLKKNVSGHI